MQDPIPMADPGPTQVDYLNQLQLQSHTQQLMEYAAMRYYSLLNAFMSGQNFWFFDDTYPFDYNIHDGQL